MSDYLIIRLSALGDVLFALSVAERLRRAQPASGIAFLVEDRFASIVAAHPAVSETIAFPRREGIGSIWRTVRQLGTRKFDAVLDLQSNAKSAMFLAAMRGLLKIGFDRGAGREGNYLFLTKRVVPPDSAVHRVDRFLSLLAPLGIEMTRESPSAFRLSDAAYDRARALLARAGDRLKVIMHPGTSTFGLLKRWEPERFGRLAKQIAVIPGAATFVTCGPGEEPLARAAEEASCGSAMALPPARDLLDLTALLAGADLVVAADTGPLHLANRMGTPVVALFGPKDYKKYGPAFDPHAIVRREDVPCSPCARRWCDAPACMASITVEEVAFAARGMLTKKRAMVF
ncbi:MAG: glycosyltransferase family 9 protein [Planctomycetes bacterium]|nr:glycosyltransferase family 9 protein [Planctomycetota bacterium]